MMETRRIGIWVCVLLASVVAGCDQANREEIRAVHATLEQAIVSRDGQTVAAMMAHPSVEYHDRLLSYAGLATRQQVKQSPAFERFLILILRQVMTKEEMAQLDGRRFVSKIVSEGWFEPNFRRPVRTIADIQFTSSNVASAALVVDGIETELRYGFIKEDDRWMVDDTLVDQVYNRLIDEAASRAGVSEDRFIIQMVEAVTGERVSDSIWDPPK